MLDGKMLEIVTLPNDFKLDAPADETDKQFTFANYSNGSVYYGYAANFKVFGHALSEGELHAAYLESLKGQPAFDPSSHFPWVAVLFAAVGAGALLVLIALFLRRRRTCDTSRRRVGNSI